jgi:uroporphyrinogen III methyltransferase/synthase
MLDAVSQGKKVARIKTGDPHIFGRGLEEQTFLSENGVGWEYIPGISVFSAGLGMADMALTKRETARSFAVVSARCSGGDINYDLPKADSLIIFMGVSALERLVDKLATQGWLPRTPITILEKACMPFQKQVSGNLENILQKVKSNNVQAPAIIVLGSAAQQYNFNEKRPRILFTGLDPSNFRILGKIVHWPTIEIKTREFSNTDLSETLLQFKQGSFKYVVISSKISAKLFIRALSAKGLDGRILANSKLIVAGCGTAETMQEFGLKVDIAPEDYGSRGILNKIQGFEPGNVLVVQSATASEAMANSISKQLGTVTHLKLHEVVPNKELPDNLPSHDILYFTCPSGVRAFYEKYGNETTAAKVWSIGEVTQKQLKQLGVNSEIVTPYVS